METIKAIGIFLLLYLFVYHTRKHRMEDTGILLPKFLYILFFPCSKWSRVRIHAVVLAPLYEISTVIVAISFVILKDNSAVLSILNWISIVSLFFAFSLEFIIEASYEKNKTEEWVSRILGIILMGFLIIWIADVPDNIADICYLCTLIAGGISGITLSVKVREHIIGRIVLGVGGVFLLGFAIVWLIDIVAR